MSVETKRFIRKPLYVDAVRITAANFDEVVSWCQGEVDQDDIPGKGTTKKFIKVRVHNPKNVRQTKAFVGDWLLYTERGYKVYTNKAFHASFDLVSSVHLEANERVTEEIAEEMRSMHPTTLDQIRQLKNVGYNEGQISGMLGLSVDILRSIESNGRLNNVERASAQESIEFESDEEVLNQDLPRV